ncbi:unnamed protein product [Mesocestoides corti]|uniref:Dynein attachment factor N-terminal domain-containing protein n=1 Tax=Mesocestoides corti TaxID=53468 RepID=A0A0R3U916_MESCO|nr:unnamed protein product [Mesocestoides corti]
MEYVDKAKSESHLKSLDLSVDRLESDLQRAVRHEERHWKENDAKLRAVHQKVATYDEFRGIVDGCELRPLKLKEVEDATKRYAGWAPALVCTNHTSSYPPSGVSTTNNSTPDSPSIVSCTFTNPPF